MSTVDILVRLGGVFALVALNAFFVAAEFALVGARRTRLDHLADGGDAAAGLALRLQGDLDRYIAAAQLGITLASLALGWIGETTIAALLEPPIESLLTTLLGNLAIAETTALAISHAIGIGISFFVITTLHIVLGEQAPKVFAIRSPETVARFIARPLSIFETIFRPIVRFLSWATTVTLRLFGIHESDSHTKVHSADELRLLVEESAEAGILDAEEQEMLINVFSFADRPAYQAMVPRTEVVTMESDDSVRQFLDRFAETGHTRFPVLGPGGIDDIVGISSAKDLLVALRDNRIGFDDPITSLVRPAFFTPESKRIGDLLQEMRRHHLRMAILVDEYGGMAGIVTTEDLVEDIVGDLADEMQLDEKDVTTVDEHTSVVDGQIRVDEVNNELHLDLPSGDYETLAGFVLERLGRLPTQGEGLKYGNLRLTVVEMSGPRIKRIEIKRD